MKFIIPFFLFFILALSACSSSSEVPIDETMDFRVGVLYEHTVLMIEYSTAEELSQIGLASEHIVPSEFLSTEAKVKQLMLAYNTTSDDITHLEELMVAMMERWAE